MRRYPESQKGASVTYCSVMCDLPSRTGRAELERQLAKVTVVNSGFKSGILDLTSVYQSICVLTPSNL